MRHLPSVAEAEDGTPCLIVKQDDLGATFAVCAPAARRLLDDYGPRSVEVEVPDRDIPHASHPTAHEIAEALECPRDRQPNFDIRREAPWAALGGHPF